MPGGAAVPRPRGQEAAHQPREAEPVPERRHPRGGGRGEDAAAADQHEEVPGGVQDRGRGAAAHPAAGQAALRGLRGDVQLPGPADLPPGQDGSAQVPQREEGVAGKRKRAEVLFLPSKKINITNNNIPGVEFFVQDREVETDNVTGKITFVLTHSNKYILCMFPPDYSHGEVLQEKWMLWQEIEGMETLDTNAM